MPKQPDERMKGLIGIEANEFSIKQAKYANNKLAVLIRNLDMFRNDADRLLLALGGKYSNREKAYISSPGQVEKLIRLYNDGRLSGQVMSKGLCLNSQFRYLLHDALLKNAEIGRMAFEIAGIRIGEYGLGSVADSFFTRIIQKEVYARPLPGGYVLKCTWRVLVPDDQLATHVEAWVRKALNADS